MGKSINLEIDIDVKGIGRKDINNFTKTYIVKLAVGDNHTKG